MRPVVLRRRARWIAAAYGLALLLVVFWPQPVDRHAGGALRSLLAGLHALGAPAWLDYGLVEWLANVAMFIPFGFLLAAALAPRHWCAAPAVALGVSMGVELAQHLLLRDRFATLADVAANTTGALVGTALCAVVFIRLELRARRGGAARLPASV